MKADDLIFQDQYRKLKFDKMEVEDCPMWMRPGLSPKAWDRYFARKGDES